MIQKLHSMCEQTLLQVITSTECINFKGSGAINFGGLGASTPDVAQLFKTTFSLIKISSHHNLRLAGGSENFRGGSAFLNMNCQIYSFIYFFLKKDQDNYNLLPCS